jgi:hypothetical protein
VIEGESLISSVPNPQVSGTLLKAQPKLCRDETFLLQSAANKNRIEERFAQLADIFGGPSGDRTRLSLLAEHRFVSHMLRIEHFQSKSNI